MIVKKSNPSSDVSGSDCGTVAKGHNALNTLSAQCLYDIVCRRVWSFEVYRNGAVTPGVVELMAAVGDEHKLDAQLARGFVKAAGLIAKFGGEDKHAFWV